MKVKVTKVDTTPSGRWEYDDGDVGALLEGYTVTGTLKYEMRVGERLEVLRESRNGVEKEGVFSTSPLAEMFVNTVDSRVRVLTESGSLYDVEEL